MLLKMLDPTLRTPPMEQGMEEVAGIAILPPEKALEIIRQDTGAILLDVRSEAEHLAKHIPGSINIPLNLLMETNGEGLGDKNQTIIVYCQVGIRSEKAGKFLEEAGYKHVYYLAGLDHWPYDTVSGTNLN